MSITIPDEIIMIMHQFRVGDDYHWISDLISPVELCFGGYRFIPMPIDGLIVLSKSYPLGMQDLPINDHVRFCRFMNSLEARGSVATVLNQRLGLRGVSYKYISRPWTNRIDFFFDDGKIKPVK